MSGKARIAAIISFAGVLLLLIVSIVVSKDGAMAYSKEQIERGRLLATVGGCHDCHSPKVMTAQGPAPDSSRLLSGHPANETVPTFPQGVFSESGWVAATNHHFTAWIGPWGISFAANLTPDNLTGIGAWTENSFIKAMRTGKHMGAGRPILPPMPWFNLAELPDEDLRDMFAFLKSLKPVSNQVPLPIPPAGK
jgi:hypothetical protein